jgi:hypothetical protein
MSTTLPEPTAPPVVADSPDSTGRNPWLVPLVALTGIVALGDVVFMALIPTLIPPLVAGVVLTLVGIALVRRRRRAAVVVLGLTSAALALAGIAFLSSHLTHPGSPIDFLHAALAIVGRALAVVAAVGAWRRPRRHRARPRRRRGRRLARSDDASSVPSPVPVAVAAALQGVATLTDRRHAPRSTARPLRRRHPTWLDRPGSTGSPTIRSSWSRARRCSTSSAPPRQPGSSPDAHSITAAGSTGGCNSLCELL